MVENVSGTGGLHLVRWDEVCKPTTMGDLGFQNLSIQNDDFLMKIGYNILACKDALWVKFLRVKYKCVDRVPIVLHDSQCSRLWKGLGFIWEDVKNNCMASKNAFLGDGSVVSFVTNSGEWRWSDLEQALPIHVLLHLATIKFPLSWFGDTQIS
ncbi:hypothetical protein V6N13_075033 [Hibiscus sabdariffa]